MPSATHTPCANEFHVELKGVHLQYGERVVMDGLSCRFPTGRISVVLGGSGVGKSTLLRLIGGLVQPDAGAVEVCGRDITRLPERELFEVRDQVGMMFQNGALLDSLTVFDNLAFPLREHAGLGEEEVRRRVEAALASVALPGIGGLLPGQLSGGMVKRVALARAMILGPEILLCDEPFSGLDPISTKRIERLLMDFNRERGVTIVSISHDVASTLRMADHIVVLFPDAVHQGTAEELLAGSDPRLGSFLSLDAGELPGGLEEDVERAPGSAAGLSTGTGRGGARQ